MCLRCCHGWNNKQYTGYIFLPELGFYGRWVRKEDAEEYYRRKQEEDKKKEMTKTIDKCIDLLKDIL